MTFLENASHLETLLGGDTYLSGLAVKAADGSMYADGNSLQDREQLPTIENYVSSYLRTEGRELAQYLQQKSKGKIKLDGIGSAKLPEGVVAAVASNNYSRVLLANRDFESNVRQLAQNYGLNFDEGMTYVLSHEMVHAAGEHSEVKTEKTLTDYFMRQAGKYMRLAVGTKGELQQDYQKQAQSYQRLATVAKTRAALGEEKLKGRAVVEGYYTNN
ncbi:hypothetical protein HY488_02400 [Candidatus Woesearchaeota archaeon]|nr:hypothetical protein [Candidatus Woesearchaeota archaeon]